MRKTRHLLAVRNVNKEKGLNHHLYTGMLWIGYLRVASRKTKRKSLKTCRLHRCPFRDDFIAASLKRGSAGCLVEAEIFASLYSSTASMIFYIPRESRIAGAPSSSLYEF